jgi:hypothetical protein
MKIAILKLGGRIANEGHGITAFEAVSVSKMLSYSNHVDCFTKISNKDKPIPELNILEITEHYNKISGNYDALVVLNGNINFYGGVETPEQILNLHIINNFDGPVFYIFIDTLLPLKNVWNSIQRKSWSKKYQEKDILITRKDIVYITMCYDTNAVYKITNKTGINPAKVIYFPFEKYAFFNDRLEYIGTKNIDLIYGANSFRNKREKKIIKFYFDFPEDIKVLFYGKMKSTDFNSKLVDKKRFPLFEGPIKYNENLIKMNNALCTINISDTFNEGRQLNPRIYETVLGNVVSFMDIDYDPLKKAFKDPELQDFLYVKEKNDVIDKIKKLKLDNTFMKKIINLQYQDSFISQNDLSEKFCELISSL